MFILILSELDIFTDFSHPHALRAACVDPSLKHVNGEDCVSSREVEKG